MRLKIVKNQLMFEVSEISSVEYYFRIFHMSPGIRDVKKEVIPVLERTIKDLGKEGQLDQQFFSKLIELLNDEKCIYDMIRELRVAGYNIALDELVNIINVLRANGLVFAIGVKNPDNYERAEVVSIIPRIEKETTPLTKEAVEQKIDVSTLKEEIDTIFQEEKVEEAQPEVSPLEEAVPGELPIEIVKVGEVISDKIKFDLESILALNKYIQHIVIATKDGLPVLQVTRKDTPALDESKIAAASSVIMAMSKRTTDEIGKKRLDNVVIKTDQSLFVVGYIDSSYILTFIMNADTPMGLTLTDFNSLRKKIVDIIKSM